MSYQIEILPKAQKELNILPLKIRNQIERKIEDLAINPYPSGIKTLKGYPGLFRLRVGNYRVIYKIENQRLIITIIKVGNRKEIYRNLKK